MEVGSWQFWVGFVIVVAVAGVVGYVLAVNVSACLGFFAFAGIIFLAGLIAHIVDSPTEYLP